MKTKNYRKLMLPVSVIYVLFATGLFGQNIDIGRQGSLKLNYSARGAPASPAGCGDGWDTTFTTNGTNGTVRAVVADGAGNIYIGGDFTSVQGQSIARIAKWDGTSWSALGVGINNTVNAIAVSGTDVYVGGDFGSVAGTPTRNVAKWNGSSWSTLGAGLGGGTHVVTSVAVYGGELYAGGLFSISDGSPANGIARWNGTAWVPVGANGQANAMAVAGGNLYVGGFVGLIGGNSVGIVKFDGTTWSALGTAVNTNVNALAVSGTDVYAVGQNVSITGQGTSNAAKWNGSAWTLIPGVFSNAAIQSATVLGGELYIGGQLPAPGSFHNIARWNGSAWVPVGAGVVGGFNRIYSMATSGSTIIAGGDFVTAGTVGARNIATYTAGAWVGFAGTGVDSPANAIAVSGSDVYAGGSFISAGLVTANRIAKWNSLTNTWSALGTGITADNTSVGAIAVAGNKVYAGGSFGNIGGVTASNIAVWNGTTWAPLGTGVNGFVSAIIVRGEDVYVGGSFSTAGGVPANYVAKWNGTAWSALGASIIPNGVSGMAFMGNDLYVGSPTNTSANPAYFSKYDGTTWTALGADLGDRGVSSVAVVGTDVYVAGGFTSINGLPVNLIAKWNGSSWSALGGGLPSPTGQFGSIRLAVSGNNLVAIGDFTVAGGGPADRIAKWNGTAWSALGTGLNGDPSSVMSAGGDIFVGGSFTTAGCNQSPNFARWRENVWTGSTNSDWHTSTNWGDGAVPTANAGISIGSANVSISSADVTVSSLIVTGGRTVTIGAGRKLTVTGTLDLSSGSVTGPGTLVVNDLSMNGGNVTNLAALTVNGNLYLGSGTISGAGTVTVPSCRPGAIAGGGSTSFVSSPLSRCVDSSGTYRFPVGTGGAYAPVVLSSVSGSGTFTIEPKAGAFAGAATGLPANRLSRWWNMTNGGITQATLTFNYNDAEVVGIEGRYRAYSIVAGAAALEPTTENRTTNTAVVTGTTTFAAWTLAEGPATFETLSGRVTTPRGRGADHLLVTLTDGSGNVRYTTTNDFGYYRFPDVETWKNYTTGFQSKKYQFASPTQTFEFTESNPAVNFATTNH